MNLYRYESAEEIMWMERLRVARGWSESGLRKIKYTRPFFQIYTSRFAKSFYSFLFLSCETLTKWGYGIFLFFSFVFENGYLRSVVKSNGIFSYREIYACNLKILCIYKAEDGLYMRQFLFGFEFLFFFLFYVLNIIGIFFFIRRNNGELKSE